MAGVEAQGFLEAEEAPKTRPHARMADLEKARVVVEAEEETGSE